MGSLQTNTFQVRFSGVSFVELTVLSQRTSPPQRSSRGPSSASSKPGTLTLRGRHCSRPLCSSNGESQRERSLSIVGGLLIIAIRFGVSCTVPPRGIGNHSASLHRPLFAACCIPPLSLGLHGRLCGPAGGHCWWPPTAVAFQSSTGCPPGHSPSLAAVLPDRPRRGRRVGRPLAAPRGGGRRPVGGAGRRLGHAGV